MPSKDEFISESLLKAAVKAVQADIKFETENNEMSLPDEVLQEIIAEVTFRIGRFIRRRVRAYLKTLEWSTTYEKDRDS